MAIITRELMRQFFFFLLVANKKRMCETRAGSRPSGKLSKIGGKRGASARLHWGAKEKYFVSERAKLVSRRAELPVNPVGVV